MKHKISVIVPVYNVEPYLSHCLDSIINQSYENIEIIVIDDGSTDYCAEICDEYASADNRIKVIHQQNGGLSAARNAGIKVATGEFIIFVDSDDIIAGNFCEMLLRTALQTDADIVECGFVKFESVTKQSTAEVSATIRPETFTATVALELLMKGDLKQAVWNKVYRREVVHDVKFPVGKLNEDEFWTYKVFGNARKIAKIDNCLYFYRQQAESIMGRDYNIKRLDGLLAMRQRIAYMRKHFPELENLAVKTFCIGSMWHYQKIAKHPEIDPDGVQRKQIVNEIALYNNKLMTNQWTMKERFWYCFFLALPRKYAALRNHLNVGT